MSTRLTKQARELALEFVSIVVGVLLALGLSEWADDREHVKLANAAITNINSELASNLATLKVIHENNVITIESIDNPDVDDEDRSFIPGMQLQETAWRTFLATGLSAYVEYETILKLSNVYSIQGIYKQTGQQVIEATMAASAFAAASGTDLDNDHFTDQFADYLRMLVAIEEQLLKAYADVAAEK